MYKLYVCVAILQITVQWKSNLFFVAAGTVGNMIIEWHNMVSLAVLSLAFQFAFFIYMNTIYRSDLTNRVMISYLHNSAFSRKVSQSFVMNIFFIFVRNVLHVLHVCLYFCLKSDCHIPLVFEACFFYTCWESVLCMYLDDTVRWLWQVLSLWLLPASGWSMVREPGAVSEWESERMGKERQHIRVWAWFRCGRTSTSLTWRSSCVSYKYKWHNTARVSPHKGKSRENSHVTRNAFWYRNGKMRFWQNAEYWL